VLRLRPLEVGATPRARSPGGVGSRACSLASSPPRRHITAYAATPPASELSRASWRGRQGGERPGDKHAMEKGCEGEVTGKSQGRAARDRPVCVARGLATLGHPWTVGALVVWLANDLVLKGSWPGSITGKLGDVASLVVLGAVASVIFSAMFPGRWLGGVPYAAAVVVAVPFAALNLSAALASEWSGLLSTYVVPSRWWADPTDLIALPALIVPVLLWHQAGVRRVGPKALGAHAMLLALAATASLATSCGSDPFIVGVTAKGSDLWVASADNWSVDDYAVSRDGGRSWTVEQPPAGVRISLDATARAHLDAKSRPDPQPLAPVVKCDADACWRAVGEQQLEKSAVANGPWTIVWEDPKAEREQIAEDETIGCLIETPVGVSDLVIVNGSVVGALGARGVLVGDGRSFEVLPVAALNIYPAGEEPRRWWWADFPILPAIGIGMTLGPLVAFLAFAMLRRFARRTKNSS
jgi:hypothetical protein